MNNVMNFSSTINIKEDATINKTKTVNTMETKPVVYCGLCGAEEQYVTHGKTECPNCDEFYKL